MKEKVVVVVGGSSGMGKSTALALAERGAHVVVAARGAEQLSAVEQEIKAKGGSVMAEVVDAANRVEAFRLFGRVKERFGRVDIVVYAAGTNIPQRSLDVLSEESWREVLETNLSGPLHCTQAALPLMLEQKDGLIIYISSVAAKRGDQSGVSYQASKRGLDGLAYGAMEELKGSGIRITVIYPGLCDTPMLAKRPVPTPLEQRQKALQPEDVAAACLFVATLPGRVHIPELVMRPSQL